MVFEPFSSGTSWLHQRDGRVKVVLALLFSLLLSLLASWPVALLGLGLALGLVLLARLPLRQVLARLAMVNVFILLLWLTLPLVGEADLELGPLAVNQRGLEMALLITLKSNAIVLLLLALVATSSLAVLGQALQLLLVPEKFCLLLLYTYRYIFVLTKEFDRLRRAATLRGFVPTTSLHTYRTYGNMIGMTLVRGWRRGQRVQQAMVLRGFTGRYHGLTVTDLGRADLLLLTMGLAGLFFITGLELRAGGTW
ncbi:MAG: cobalt ECF transporter T component CbiQ [Thermodesulfobacteriota bacterium]